MQNVQNKTVLVIDDDATIRKLISHHLISNKFNVLMAENAEDAFQILDDHSIDIVLCDVTLGNMDGFTFCQKVRENEKHRLIPFVFVTAKSSLSDKSSPPTSIPFDLSLSELFAVTNTKGINRCFSFSRTF